MLNDLNCNEEEQEEQEEMDLGGSSGDDFLDSLDWVTSQGQRSKSVENLFGNEEYYYDTRSIAFYLMMLSY